MKLLLISDPHVCAGGRLMLGSDPVARLQAVLRTALRRHRDVDRLVLLGDLTESGSTEEYTVLKRCLAELPFPVTLLVGNHDSRPALRAAFPDLPLDAGGFVQQLIRCAELDLLVLDTHTPEGPHGRYCAARRAWLKQALELGGDRPVVLFMHHPPLPIGSAQLDPSRLMDHEAFEALLHPHRHRIVHLFFGHIHRLLSGSWLGIPFSALRSSSHLGPPELVNGVRVCHHGPAFYALAELGPRDTVVQFFDTESHLAAEPAPC